jgi:3-methyl-2-oxobutanoate hydroxymethyltransferase
MVLQGHDSTLPVTTADMAYHTACVKRGNDGALILPTCPSWPTPPRAGLCQQRQLMQAGAHMVKIEGAWLAESIRLLAERGVPVCAHMGLTPQP